LVSRRSLSRAQDRGGNDAVGVAPQPLSAEASASNARTAAALAKTTDIGDLHRFTSDAINTDPGSGSGTAFTKAVHEVADLIGQVHVNSPDQAKELLDKTVQGITPEHGQALHQAVRSITSPVVQDARSPSAPGGSSVNLDRVPALKGADGSEPLSISISDMPEAAQTPAIEPDASKKTPSDPGTLEEPTTPKEPDEPTKPDDTEDKQKETCQRLRLQLEVDGNNLDAAQKRFDEANKRVEEIHSKLNSNRAAKSDAVNQTRAGYMSFVLNPSLHGAAGIVGPLIEYGGKEMDFSKLAEEFQNAVAERDARYQDVEDARGQFDKTLNKLEANGCN